VGLVEEMPVCVILAPSPQLWFLALATPLQDQQEEEEEVEVRAQELASLDLVLAQLRSSQPTLLPIVTSFLEFVRHQAMLSAEVAPRCRVERLLLKQRTRTGTA
jgi:hypothetical protein